MSLTQEQLDRHRRHIMLKEIGGPGVEKLRKASVSIVGGGALGGPCAMFLAAAGVGQIELWDDDRVERSNLQRQIQFTEADIGALKTECLAARLLAQDPGLDVSARTERFDGSQSLRGDILIDASDNFETRYALNQAGLLSARPLVHGAAAGWTGQVSVFDAGRQSDMPCYRCWVPETPPEAAACDEVGVVGAVTGQVSTAMALESIKLVTGAGQPLIGALLLFDGLSGRPRTLTLRKDPACRACGRG